MAYSGLRAFIRKIEAMGELKRISYPADPYLEITEIADRVMKRGGPALLFEQPKGSAIPLLINAYGSERRMNAALGVENLDDVAQDIQSLIQTEMPKSLGDKLRAVPKLARVATAAPRTVKSGPCKEVIVRDNPSLDFLPIQTCWPEDGGPFICLPLVFSRHPVSGKRNVGMYRMQKYDSRTTGMHWQLHKVGE